MQIFSPEFLDRVGVPLINITTHSAGVPGTEPYERAKERGVKLIGATAHYVTPTSTPARSSSRTRSASATATTSDADAAGGDIERTVLARAVTWHCEDRILRHGNTTVVF